MNLAKPRRSARPDGATLRRGGVVLATALTGLTVTAGIASADAIPGATYDAALPGGARLSFAVSTDGTLVNTYSVTDLQGDTCVFNAAGQQDVWSGAPINASAFDYEFYNAIIFKGSFSGAQSATGSIRFSHDANPYSPACDTGTVTFAATTTATPPPAGTVTPGGTPVVVVTPGKPAKYSIRVKRYPTRVSLRKISKKQVGGRIVNSSRSCRSGRLVYFVRGNRRVASTHTRRDGSYVIKRTAALRGRFIRAVAMSRTLSKSAVCSAGSSVRVRL